MIVTYLCVALSFVVDVISMEMRNNNILIISGVLLALAVIYDFVQLIFALKDS